MAKGLAEERKQKSFWGALLLILGLAAILADLAFLAPSLLYLLSSAKAGLMGLVPALGMSFLNATRAIALHQVSYFALASRILVLFSALVAVVVGTTLCNARPSSAPASARQTFSGSIEGDR
ncbi:MAG: hypothetical protein WA857_00910 [Candidatus Acidiferrum sp.]